MIPAEWWNRLIAQDAADVARRACVRLGEDGSYEVDVLNQVYRIDVHARRILCVHPSVTDPSDVQGGLATVAYLVGAKAVDPVGRWVSPRELPGGYAFFRGPHALPVASIIERFGHHLGDFERACQHLGGRREPYADAAYSFALFPRLPVAVLLWLADEEFPARAAMLVNATAHQHLPLDALLAAFHMMENALIFAAPDDILAN